MDSLVGARALVTGASRGIGARVALALASRGADLALVARRQDDLEVVAQRVRRWDVRAVTIAADLADPDAARHVVGRATSGLGGVEVLVNDAALEGLGSFTDTAPSDVAEIVHVNLTVALLLTRFALPAMLERGEGHVVNISSLMGKSAAPYHAAYSSTKFGMVGMAQALRLELRDSGVGVSVICPGLVIDEGMHARLDDTGARRARLLLGTTTTTRVAGAVLDAIERDRPEIMVTPVPVRPLLALGALSPRLADAIVHAVGVTRMYRAAVERSGDHARSTHTGPDST